MLPFGLPGKYWSSIQEYEPLKLSKKQSWPYLILNGDRDYQVTVAEAEKWKNGSQHKQSKTIIYPGLNHMFFSGTGVCIPAEYEKQGHMELVVLENILEWINQL